VVSGINVGIMAFAVFWALRLLPFGETWATILTILLSWGYAFVADLGSPIVRATITLNVYLLSRLLFRDRAGLNALGIAALGILLVNPRTLFEASFQLTFLSVIGVAGIAVPILRRIYYPWQRAMRNLDSVDFALTLPTAGGAIPLQCLPCSRGTGKLGWRASRQHGGRTHDATFTCCGRTALHLNGDSAGAGAADDLVFPPRDHNGSPS
jgi:ComEC/Rec2-related protein